MERLEVMHQAQELMSQIFIQLEIDPQHIKWEHLRDKDSLIVNQFKICLDQETMMTITVSLERELSHLVLRENIKICKD
jgi:hypothetical protein